MLDKEVTSPGLSDRQMEGSHGDDHEKHQHQRTCEKVFAYLDEPTNNPEWMVSLVEVTDVTGSGVGQRYNWEYKMIGVPFRGESTVTEQVANEHAVVESKGGIPSTFTFTFTPLEAGTKLELQVEYTVPVPVLGKMAEKLVLRRNEREADLWMENIKERLEV